MRGAFSWNGGWVLLFSLIAAFVLAALFSTHRGRSFFHAAASEATSPK
jgi:hypothetical protein